MSRRCHAFVVERFEENGAPLGFRRVEFAGGVALQMSDLTETGSVGPPITTATVSRPFDYVVRDVATERRRRGRRSHGASAELTFD